MIPAKVFSIISGKIFADNLIDFSYIVCWDWNFSPRAKLRRTAQTNKASNWASCTFRVKTHERTLKHTSLWLGRKTQRFSGTNQMPEQLRPFGTCLVRQCPQGLFCPDLKSTHSPWISEDETDQSKCSTLQSQSFGRYSRRVTSYRSLRYFSYEKLFQWHLVCHKFLSITFAFRGCSRSAEGLNCRPDRRQTGKIPKPVCVFDENRKPNAKPHIIRKSK